MQRTVISTISIDMIFLNVSEIDNILYFCEAQPFAWKYFSKEFDDSVV